MANRSLTVLKRPCHCCAKQRERENAASKESCDLLLHGSPASGTSNTAQLDARRPEGVNRLGRAKALTPGLKLTLTHHQRREAIKRRDKDRETLPQPRSGALASGALEAFRPPRPWRTVSYDIALVRAEVQSAEPRSGEYSRRRTFRSRRSALSCRADDSYSSMAILYGGFVTPRSTCWICIGAVAEGHEEKQLLRISFPA